MADLFSSSVTRENVQDVLFVLYSLDQDKNPDPTTVTKIWDWATSEFGEPEVKQVLSEPDKRPFLELVAKVLEKVNKQEPVANIHEITEKYDRILEEKKLEADAKLAKQNKSHLKDKIRTTLDRVQANARQVDAHSPASEILAAAQESIAADIALNTVQTATSVVQLIESTSTIPPEFESSWTITPLTEEVIPELTPVLGSLKEVVKTEIASAVPSLPDEQINTTAAEILAYRIVHPDSRPEVTDKFINQLTVKLESQGYSVDEKISQVNQTVSSFTVPQSTESQLKTVLAYEYQAQTGLDPNTSQEIAQKVMVNKLLFVSYAIARATPAAGNDSPDKRKLTQKEVYGRVNQTILAVLENQIPKSTFSQIMQMSNYQRVWEASQYFEQEIYDPANYQVYDDQGNSAPNPALDYLQKQGANYFKNEVLSAWEAFMGGAQAAASTGVPTSASTALVATQTFTFILEPTSSYALTALGLVDEGLFTLGGVAPNGSLIFSATSQGVAKILASKAAQAGATTLITTGGAEVGAAAGQAAIPLPVIGAIIGAIIGFIVANLPKFSNWAKKQLENVAFGGAILNGSISSGLFGRLNSGVNSAATFTANVFTGIASVAVVEIATPILVIIASIPIIVALLLFIINTSAYIVPAGNLTSFSSGGAFTGELPEGCPAGWPLNSGTITQGAWTDPYYTYKNGTHPSHAGHEALDIGVNSGSVVKTTHNGIAVVIPINTNVYKTGYGNLVEVHSKCLYKGVEIEYFSQYAHLSAFEIASNSPVVAGQTIARSGNTGNSSGPHLHYEFRKADNSVNHYEEDKAPFLWPDFIPRSPVIPRHCPECGMSIP